MERRRPRRLDRRRPAAVGAETAPGQPARTPALHYLFPALSFCESGVWWFGWVVSAELSRRETFGPPGWSGCWSGCGDFGLLGVG